MVAAAHLGPLHVYRIGSNGAIRDHSVTPPIPPNLVTTPPSIVESSNGAFVSWGIVDPCNITCIDYPDTLFITAVDDLSSIAVPARQQSFPLVTQLGDEFLVVEDNRSQVVISRVTANGTIVSSRSLPEFLLASGGDTALTDGSLTLSADGSGSAVAEIDPVTLATRWIAASPRGWNESTLPWPERLVWMPVPRVAESGSLVTAYLPPQSERNLSAQIVHVAQNRESRRITVRITNHSTLEAKDTRVLVLGHDAVAPSDGFVSTSLGLFAPTLPPGGSRELVVVQRPRTAGGEPWYAELHVSVAGPIPDSDPADNSAQLLRSDVERTLRRGVPRP